MHTCWMCCARWGRTPSRLGAWVASWAYAAVAAHMLVSVVLRLANAPACLLRTCMQARTFGLFLCKLDIRQESVKHTEALDAITTYLGLGSYK